MSVRTVCWVNEDCIAGYHMDEIECRFPSWTEDASKETKADAWDKGHKAHMPVSEFGETPCHCQNPYRGQR